MVHAPWLSMTTATSKRALDMDMDSVLVDIASGTARRDPEFRWRFEPPLPLTGLR